MMRQVDHLALLGEISRLEKLCVHPVFSRPDVSLFELIWATHKLWELHVLKSQVNELRRAEEYL